ncbi:uncharacterized protein JCM15063_000505 [Sporobolomyces koalae]|uniref:uncharacterized protein n=1 Tax=Sporobolomyces koalae TaxID=500713 RepID=UPI0031818365
MVDSPTNGFVVPQPRLSAGFEYQPAFDELLEQISSTNVVDADWPILRDMVKHKLAEAIDDFLASGPPYSLEPEEAYRTRTRAYETIDFFTGPPFTIQRLCELLLQPRSCYRSLAKYLRAVNRVLSVTSEQSTFTEDSSDDPLLAAAVASTSAETLEYHSLGVVHDDKVLSPAHHTHRRSTTPIPSSSPATPSKSVPPQVIPLLSPIPWLSKNSPASAFEDDPPTSSPSRHSLASLPIETTRPPPLHNNAIPPSHPETATPTGGLVDEVDPGSGGQETAEPIALSSATTNLPPASPPSKTTTPADMLDKPEDSLRSRFVRASSPKVEEPTETGIEQRMNEGE